MSRFTSAEVVIVGGGLAGGTAACLLARAGRPVLLLEAAAGPVDKICGEFLSGEAQATLQRVGLDPLALGGAPISHLRLVRDDRVATVRLPFGGIGLSRRTLDEALLEQAERAGATVLRGHPARVRGHDEGLASEAQSGFQAQPQSLSQMQSGLHSESESESEPQPQPQPVSRDAASATAQRPAPATSGAPWISVAGLGELHPRTLLLATGKHDLRGLRRAPAHRPNDLVGFKMYFTLTPAAHRELAGHVEVLLFDQGYAGLQLIDGGRANLCLLVERAWLHRCAGRWEALLEDLQRQCVHLRARLNDAQPLWPRPLTIFKVPYGFVHRASDIDPPGVFRLGDQMGVIASFVGDGMAIALHSAAIASGAVLAGASALQYHQRMRNDIAGQIGRAAAMYRLGHSPQAQRVAVQLARAWPRGVQWAARLTRVPPRALVKAFA